MSLGIVNYLKTLVPHIEKDQILEDLRLTEVELENIVVPAYRDATSLFATDRFLSKENEVIQEQVTANLKSTRMGRQTTFLGEFQIRLEAVQKNIPILQKLINHEIGRDVITEGVSAKKVVLIRIAEKISYISRYSLDLLNLVYVNEASMAKTDARQLSMSPAEMAKAKACVVNLAKLLQSYGVDPKDFEKTLSKTPDILLSKNEDQVVTGSFHDSDFDSMTPAFTTGFVGNPIYHLRMAVAEWQSKRYKASQEKKKTLELRLLHLQIQKEKGEENPKLVKEIAYNQERVAKLDRYLKEVEADLEIETV